MAARFVAWQCFKQSALENFADPNQLSTGATLSHSR
jgi:hypothetical protein